MENAAFHRARRPGRGSRSGPDRPRGRSRFRPGLTELEGRRLPSTFTVASTGDGGGATLRAAVLAADSAGGSNTIVFDSSVFDGPQTIKLTQGALIVTSGPLTIAGPGAGLLTVDGSRFDRIFQVFPGISATISGLTIAGGSAAGDGGALYVQGRATLSGCTIAGSTAARGGGIANVGTLTMTGCTVSGDSAADGGGLRNTGTLTMTDCTLSGNSATYDGGALWNRGTATLTGCTIAGGSAYLGGGVSNYKGGQANLTDCTITGNSADLGGGLANYGRAGLTACTVSGNTAVNTSSSPASNPGGGIYNYSNHYGGLTNLLDTIVAGNSGPGVAASDIGGDNAGSVIGSYNLVGTGGRGGLVGGLAHNVFLTDAASLRLGAPGDYGGPTSTLPLLPGSPAIGAGTAAAGVTTDQRGFAIDSPVDIGAYQAVALPLVVGVATDGVGAPSGALDLRAAVNLANLSTTAVTITFDPSAFAAARTIALTDGALALAGTGGTIAIDGPAAGLTVSGAGRSGVFRVGAGASAALTGLTISGGAATTGGGLYNQGSATLTACTVTGNEAATGAGLANLGTLALVECTISGNTAALGGGAIDNAGTATLTACTVTGNASVGGGAGGFNEVASASDAATLVDTIVAGNTGVGGFASDIGGGDARKVAGSSNLIGTGGSGGIVGGSGGNIVLASLTGLGLSALGSYGGPSATVALLPGSPAIDAGSAALLPAGLNTDERGQSRSIGGGVDIGAFESQGFTLTLASGSTPQAAAAGSAFARPLAVAVAARNPAEPVAGGVVGFAVVPSGGAGATLSAGSSTIGPDGSAQVTATAGLVVGGYTVAASAAGASAATFALTNQGASGFSGLADRSIVFGTGTATFAGQIDAGTPVPSGESVTVTLDGVPRAAAIQPDNSFSATFDTTAMGVAGSPYTVSYAYAGDGTLAAASASSKLTVTPAAPTVTVADAGGTYDGSPFAATASVAGLDGQPGTSLEGVGLSLTYYAGGTASGNPIGGPPVSAGTYTVAARFAGGADYAAASAQATFTIARATPAVSWDSPAAIAYGTPMGPTQLDATASVPGSFAYNPDAGTVLAAGTRTLTTTFTPDDSTDYQTVSASTTIVVNQATPTLTWDPPAAIVYGTALGATQLDATANVKGTFAYTPAAGTVPGAGTRTLSVTFTPVDTVDYTTAAASVSIVVNLATPAIAWPAPASIVYGTALTSAQLDATANVKGTFAYNPAAGTVLGAGTQTLSVTFTPNDLVDYTTATATTSITVAKAAPVLSWATPAAIVYGTALGPSQLDASASVKGTFAYTPAAGTVPGAGTNTLSATFTPVDSADYTTATATTTLMVRQATPSLTWSPPASIVYGTALTSAQLDATASVPGSFAYSPAAGAVLGAGTQTLSVTFTPRDSVDYTSVTTTTTIAVEPATPALTWPSPSAITYGTPLGPSQLDASASIKGTFSYSPAAGSVPGAGTQTLSVTFTPVDTVDYTSATTTTTIVVNPARPVLAWSPPAPIPFGTALTSAQLDATANVKGTFAYSPAAGTVLGAGSQTLSVTFTPDDLVDYTTATTTVSIVVQGATPALTWPSPSAITYGTPLDSSQLDATATVKGTFAYSPPAGTILGAGTQTLSVTFTPDDSADYATITATTTLAVLKATPVVAWPAPASITYGTPMGPAQLDATADIPGTYAYSPAAGTIPAAGDPTLSVTFTPDDTTDYTTVTKTTAIAVAKAIPTLLVSGGGVYDGLPILATSTVAGVVAGRDASPAPTLEGVAPVLTYADGTTTTGPPVHAGTYTVVAAFPGSTDYAPATATATLAIARATPTIAWKAPAPIVYGTAIGPDQLDAAADTQGTYSYTPGSGSILGAGVHTLTVTFTPADSTDYAPATATTTISVSRATPAVAWATPAVIVYGTPMGPSQLDATASVQGTFAYAPGPGTVLGAGIHLLSVTFTPTDSADYAPATASATITVARATPTIAWDPPAAIVYGTAIGPSQLDARSDAPGTFSYTPTAGTVLGAGVHALAATFTPADPADYAPATATILMTIARATPAIAWATPAPIPYGTPMGPAQLDATAGVPGTFTYSPGPGTILGVGTHTVSLTFTPADSADLAPATATATLAVAKATPTVQMVDVGGTYDGSPFAATATVSGVGGAPGPNLEGVAPVLTYYDGSTPLGGPPARVGTYTVVASFPGSSDYADASSAPVAFTIAPAASAVSLVSSAGSAVFGQSVTLTATVASPGGGTPTGTVTFLDGSTPLGAVAIDASGRAVLTIGNLGAGSHALAAVYVGDNDRAGSRSVGVAESINPAATRIVLVPTAVRKGKRVVSITLTAEVEPLAPGVGVPAGPVSFFATKKRTRKALGTAALVGGQATLSLRAASVLNQSITVSYVGGDGFLPASLDAPRLTAQSLVRPALRGRPAARKATPMSRRIGPVRHRLSLNLH